MLFYSVPKSKLNRLNRPHLQVEHNEDYTTPSYLPYYVL